jgi:hypothetical protein
MRAADPLHEQKEPSRRTLMPPSERRPPDSAEFRGRLPVYAGSWAKAIAGSWFAWLAGRLLGL